MLCTRPCRVIHSSRAASSRQSNSARAFSFTRRVCDDDTGADSDDALDDAAAILPEDVGEGHNRQMMYSQWIATEGRKWRYPDALGPKWLGGDIPFPLNRTFRPPSPISDALRTTIYTAFLSNPKENDLRTLSTRYGVALKRVEAIIRLKELEEQWKKSKPLQTGFLHGMERLLGLNVGGQMTPVADEVKSTSRREVAQADEVSRQITEEHEDNKRGVSRTFFEPVDEGELPIVPGLLDQERRGPRASEARPTYPTTVVRPDPTKPGYKFVDVGLRWVNRADLEKRAKESARRKAIKNARKMAQNCKGEQVAPAA